MRVADVTDELPARSTKYDCLEVVVAEGSMPTRLIVPTK
jgi:hypothetical protein